MSSCRFFLLISYLYILGPLHTSPEKVMVNAALILRLGLPSTLICYKDGTFRKRPSNRRNLKTSDLNFRVDWKHVENAASRKRWRHNNHVISLTAISSNTNPKWLVIVAFLNFSGLVWTEIIYCVFKVKTPQIDPAWCWMGLSIKCAVCRL